MTRRNAGHVKAAAVSGFDADAARLTRVRGVVASSALVACALVFATGDARAQLWRLEPSVTARIEATNNVNLESGAARQSDLVTQLAPALTVFERGAHTSLSGSIVMPVLLYARTGSENNAVRPEVALTGKAELVQRLFYLDASVNVSQQFVSPFAPRPTDIASATENRNTTQSYRVSPYFKGQGASDISYELRDNNTWTVANGIAATGDRAYTNEVIGHIDRAAKPVGWGLDYDRIDTSFVGSEPLVTQIARGRVDWRASPDWQLSAIAGYEDNRFPLASFTSPVYGLEAKWKPSDRTSVDAEWEHRFFGGSYHLGIDERTPLTVWTLRAFRDITTYPQQLATLAQGADVNALLDQLFSGRVADPLQRQSLVQQLIRERGLPAVLSSPLSLFSDQVTLQESVQGTAGFLGARNTIFLTLFRTKSEPVRSVDLTSDLLLQAQTNNTQTGANVVWSHRLTPLYTLSTTFTWARTIANDITAGHSTQAEVQSTVSAPLSRLTSTFAGLRYQRFWSNVNTDFNEAAVFIGITHIFR